MVRKLVFVFSLALVLTLVVVGCGGGKKKEPTPTPKPAPTATSAPTPTPSGPSPEAVAEGKKLFEQTCSACHGKDAKGLPNLGKDLTTSEFVKGLSDDELLAFIKKGRPVSDPANTTGVDMPPKGGNPALTDDQLRAIIAFIRSIEE